MHFKNPTPIHLSIFGALVIGTSVLSISLFLPLGYLYIAVLVSLTIIVSGFVVYLILKHFIYRKIKVIYKQILDFKNTTQLVQKEKLNLSSDVLSAAESDVKEWIEIQSREIDKLKEQELFRRRFLQDVSHELRTPLFNIQGYLETIYEGDIQDANIHKDFLEKAMKNVNRLNAIIDDLDKISQLEKGGITLTFTTFPIKELVMEVFDLLAYTAQKRNITIDFKKSCANNPLVYADREKIKEVLINLITNSIKYGRENGTVLVGCYDLDDKILVEVSDNGIGIPQEHLPHIFNRFYRVDKTRSRSQGGTGLGLSIVKHIIEVHNQTISVRSTPGEGSTFGFTLDKYQK